MVKVIKNKVNEVNKLYEKVFKNSSKNVIDDQKLKENDMRDNNK